jgi:hypothetical protein
MYILLRKTEEWKLLKIYDVVSFTKLIIRFYEARIFE